MPFKRIYEFNKEVIGIDRKIISSLLPDEAQWLVGAWEEEAGEFVDAFNKSDIPGQVDAIIDLMYFAVGGLVRLGLSPEVMEQCFAAVHETNMGKVKGRKQREVESDLDAVKLEDWEAPEGKIKQVLEKTNDSD
jgi:predicted HAD superfamily Cof-like phosphohydrolase